MTAEICGGGNLLTATSEIQNVTSRSLVVTEKAADNSGY
jgi:hypothetical protein